MTRMFGDSLVWGLRLFVLFVVSVRPASAQETVCGDPAQILEALNRDYGEEPVWTGTSGGAEVIIMANPEGTTWTVVTLDPDGQACMRAAGEGWRAGGALVDGEQT